MKKGNGVVIAILVIIVLVLSGYILYDKVIKKGNEKKPQNESTVVTYKEYNIGNVIYFNPVTNASCISSEYSKPENKTRTTGCLKWYVIEKSGENTKDVKVILESNTTYNLGMMKAAEGLGVNNSTIKSELNKLVNENGWKVTPTIITVSQLKTITGSSVENIFLSDYSWLTDNMYDGVYSSNVAGTGFGYWISGEEEIEGEFVKAYYVSWDGKVNKTRADSSSFTAPGIRPVITIDKNNLK